MVRKFTSTEHVYIRSMGKLLRITAIATSDDEANSFMSKNDEAAVVADCGGFVFMADRYDHGTKITDMLEHGDKKSW